MEYILLFLILLNGMLFLSSVFKQKIEKMLFPLIVVYIIVLYIFGIMSIMNIGFWVLIASNIVMLVYNIIGFIKKKIDINKILTPGLIIFFICYVFFVFLSKGRLISVWDEFSHWALVTKNMFIFDSLKLGGSSNVMFDYFSGIPMFQYFCVTLAGSFTEKMLYVAQNVVLLSCLLPTLSMFENKKSYIPYLFFIILFLTPTFFYNDIYTSLYADGCLGLVLAYTLYSYYFDNESSTGYKYINLALSFLMLYFVKELGFYLGLSVFTMIIISKALAKNLTKKEFKYLIYTIIPVLLVKFSWSSLVNVWGFTDMFNTGNIVNLFKLNFLPYHIKVLENFFNALTYTSLTNSLYPISYFVILGFAILISYFLMGREKQKEKKVFIVSIVIGWLIYAAFTLVSYMFLFNEYEALKLASYTRYMSVYALAMIVFLFILCFNEGLKKPKSINKIFIVVIFIFCLGFNINNLAYLTIFTSVDKENTTYLRSQFNTMTEKVGKYVKDGEKVYFIASDTDGFEFYIAKYLLTPLRINEDSWSIGNVYDEEDVWTTYISSSDWKSILIDEYDYVYVYKTDEQFIDTYGSLFAEDTVENDQLYRINKDSSTAILELVS